MPKQAVPKAENEIWVNTVLNELVWLAISFHNHDE